MGITDWIAQIFGKKDSLEEVNKADLLLCLTILLKIAGADGDTEPQEMAELFNE